MAGFDAGIIVDDFNYDFTKAGGNTGSVPMPTMAEVRKYRDSILAAQRRVCGLDLDAPINDETTEQLDQALDNLTPQQRDQLNDEALDIVAEICNGHPSRDEILALPGPVQFAFARWLQVQLSPLF